MKYKTLFRLMLKAVGVWLFVAGATQLLTFLGYVIRSLLPEPGINFGPWINVALQLLAPALQVGIGLYLFFDGKWVADKAIPGNRDYCHECGYDLTVANGHVCAECGTPFKSEVQA